MLLTTHESLMPRLAQKLPSSAALINFPFHVNSCLCIWQPCYHFLNVFVPLSSTFIDLKLVISQIFYQFLIFTVKKKNSAEWKHSRSLIDADIDD